MMKIFFKTTFLIGCLFIVSCASQTGWAPTVDPYGDPNAYRLDQDLSECQYLAAQASGGTAQETAIGAGTGALIGAASGALLGAISGNAGKGAAIGASIGGIGGGAKQGFQAEHGYKRSYANCMQHRGHYVVN